MSPNGNDGKCFSEDAKNNFLNLLVCDSTSGFLNTVLSNRRCSASKKVRAEYDKVKNCCSVKADINYEVRVCTGFKKGGTPRRGQRRWPRNSVDAEKLKCKNAICSERKQIVRHNAWWKKDPRSLVFKAQ